MASIRAAELRSVAVLRALPGVGDFLCAVPALRALRDAAPRAHVTLIGLPETVPLAARFAAYVDEFLPFPGYPGIPESPSRPDVLEAFVRESRGRRFDLAIQMHGNGSVMNGLLMRLGARAVLGYRMPCADPHRGLHPALPGDPEVRRWTRLVERLEGVGADERLEFPMAPSERRAAEETLRSRGLVPGGFVCVHPGAASASRRWGAAGFARVVDEIASAGVRVALTGGPGDREVCDEVARRVRERGCLEDLCGDTPLGELAAILARARLAVCNDTGVAHLAGAVRTPRVVVFTGATAPGRWSSGGDSVCVAPRRASSATPGNPAPLPGACGGLPCPVLADRPGAPVALPAREVLAAVRFALRRPAAAGGDHVA